MSTRLKCLILIISFNHMSMNSQVLNLVQWSNMVKLCSDRFYRAIVDLAHSCSLVIITARKRSLGQGNIFTPVCHSVHRGGMHGCSRGGMHGCSGVGHVWLLQGVCGFIWGACMVLFGGVLGHCHATISLICMRTHKAMAARCLSYHQAAYRQPAIRALATAPLRRLALSVLFTIATNSYQTTCTVSERTFNKRQHANARHGVDFSLPTHYDMVAARTQP